MLRPGLLLLQQNRGQLFVRATRRLAEVKSWPPLAALEIVVTAATHNEVCMLQLAQFTRDAMHIHLQSALRRFRETAAAKVPA